MKKLAIVLLLVMAGCHRQAVVTSAPANVGGSGGATPREALDRFMASAKAQDLQAMSNVWGSAAGPVRGKMPQEELEMREIYMMRCLRHDSYTVKAEPPAPAGDRAYTVEVKRGNLTATTDFYTTRGPENRWYVLKFEPKDLNSICTSR